MESFNKLRIVNVKDIDKSNVFIGVDSVSWRSLNKISIQDLIDNIKIDPSTLHIEVISPSQITSSVFSEKFIDQNITYYKPPKDASLLSGMHLMTDDNYLYVWVGNRWKRTILAEW